MFKVFGVESLRQFCKQSVLSSALSNYAHVECTTKMAEKILGVLSTGLGNSKGIDLLIKLSKSWGGIGEIVPEMMVVSIQDGEMYGF